MKKIALSVCLIALVLFAFTGCGLLETEVKLENKCSSAITVTVTCAGSSTTKTIAPNSTAVVKVMRDETVTYSYPTRDANNNSIYKSVSGSGPFTVTFTNHVIN